MTRYVADGYWVDGYAVGEAGASYDITITPGEITLAGQNIAVVAARNISITPGSIALTGATINPTVSRSISVTPSAITLTGASVSISVARSITVEPGTITLTGAEVVPVYDGSVEPQPTPVVIDRDYVAPRTKFWSQKQAEWLEDRLEQIKQAAPKPRKARKRIAREILTELPQIAGSAPHSLQIDVVRSLAERIAAPSPDYTAIAAVVAAQMQQIEAERTARRRKRDAEAVLILAA